MSNIDLRYELEFGIIRWCVEHDAFHLVADILSHKNFNRHHNHFGYQGLEKVQLHHSIIVKQMERMLYNKPITWQTLGRELENEYKAPYTYYLHVHRTTERLYGHSMRYFAMSLMEMDIREKVIDILKKHEEHARSLEKYDDANNLKQIRKTIEPAWFDFFEAMDECQQFLNYMEYEEVLEEVKQITAAIPKKIDKIRTKAKWQLMFRYLESMISLPEYDKQRLTLHMIHKAYLKVLSGKELPENQQQTLQDIATL